MPPPRPAQPGPRPVGVAGLDRGERRGDRRAGDRPDDVVEDGGLAPVRAPTAATTGATRAQRVREVGGSPPPVGPLERLDAWRPRPPPAPVRGRPRAGRRRSRPPPPSRGRPRRPRPPRPRRGPSATAPRISRASASRRPVQHTRSAGRRRPTAGRRRRSMRRRRRRSRPRRWWMPSAKSSRPSARSTAGPPSPRGPGPCLARRRASARSVSPDTMSASAMRGLGLDDHCRVDRARFLGCGGQRRLQLTCLDAGADAEAGARPAPGEEHRRPQHGRRVAGGACVPDGPGQQILGPLGVVVEVGRPAGVRGRAPGLPRVAGGRRRGRRAAEAGGLVPRAPASGDGRRPAGTTRPPPAGTGVSCPPRRGGRRPRRRWSATRTARSSSTSASPASAVAASRSATTRCRA